MRKFYRKSVVEFAMKMRAEVTMWSSSGSAFERDTYKSSLDIRTISSKAPVSRAITFGSPISSKKMDNNYHLVRDQMDQMRICEKSRWGFDFFNETPLSSSKYDWKKNSSDSLSSYSYIGTKKCENKNSSPFSSKNNSYENLSKTTTTNSSSGGGGCK